MSDDYVDEEFEEQSQADSDNTQAKMSVDQSGRLPPLSTSFPAPIGTQRSGNSFMQSREGGTSRFLYPDSALKSRSGTKGGDQTNPLNLGES